MSDKREAVIARRSIVATVAAAFIPAEQGAEAAARNGANCMTVMMDQRRAALLPAQTGSEALVLIATGTRLAAEAQAQFAAAHALLRDLPEQLGLPMALGPYCEPNSPPRFFGIHAVK